MKKEETRKKKKRLGEKMRQADKQRQADRLTERQTKRQKDGRRSGCSERNIQEEIEKKSKKNQLEGEEKSRRGMEKQWKKKKRLVAYYISLNNKKGY